MNRRYMDFVPARSNKPVPSRRKETVARRETGVTHRVVRTNEVISERVDFDARTMQAARLGVVDELTPRHINSSAVKRPAVEDERVARPVNSGIRAIKPVEKPVEKVAKKKEAPKVVKSPFINQDKVVKRPLSGHGFRKEVAVPQEVPKGPVTIIAKPEKDAHVSMIVTIILTIILGAAAGTVAFLLLPK